MSAIQYKTLKKLYLGKYQHKIVLVCRGAHLFRGGNLDKIEHRIEVSASDYISDKAYLYELIDYLKSINDYTIRIEGSLLSIYTIDESHIRKIKKLNSIYVREIHNVDRHLNPNEIISTLPYDYKVHLVNKGQPNKTFLEWAQDNANIRVTKSTQFFLSNPSRWPLDGYFYIKGENNLTMAKLYLGNLIKKIEKIVCK